jgi:prepilin signal peptidase PulO-like enzyme (type II secretory pathway)
MSFIYLTFLGLLGLVIGSFLNAWVWRLHAGRSIIKGRSMCTSCERQLLWHDLIPVISFIRLRGQCRFCRAPISWQFPLIELWLGLSFAAVGVLSYSTQTFLPLPLVRDLLILFVLTFLFVYDVLYQELPDQITLPAIIFFGLIAIMYHFQTISSVLIGMFVGGGVFLIQYVISRGKWIGGGDIRLGMLMGVILGWPLVLLALFIAYITGAIYGVALLALKKASMQSKVPFGAFLTTATLLSMVWGDEIIGWYLGLLR